MGLPKEVQLILKTLQGAGFEAYVVGGCVRDLLLKREPADWDVATKASPEEIQRLFKGSFYNNQFGTVVVLVGDKRQADKIPPTPPLSRGASIPAINNASPYEGEVAEPACRQGRRSKAGGVDEVEVTTYRVDSEYSDQRHPDNVRFTASLEEDLARRDFTVNAMALAPQTPFPRQSGGLPLSKGEKNTVVIEGWMVIDPFGGLKDLDAKLIRAVGEASDRFGEDALRLMRAVRLAAQLDFEIEETTLAAVKKQAEDIEAVSNERVRDELIKIVMSEAPEKGFNLLEETGLLKRVMPELVEGVGVDQNKHHTFTVFEHSVKSLQYAANFGYSLEIRLAALWHDIGKPRTRRFAPVPGGAANQGDYTFHAHDIVGARMTEKLMKRLRFSNELIRGVSHLVRHHMFYYDVGKVTEAGARRLLRRVGKNHFDDLIKLRIAERKGSGVPKAEPYRLRHLQFMVDKASREPVSVGELAIKGGDLIGELKLSPSPVIGGILNALLAEVLDDPKKNNRKYLLGRARELKNEDAAELKALGESAKDAEEKRREDEIRRKYHV